MNDSILFNNNTDLKCPTIDEFNQWIQIIKEELNQDFQVSIEIVDANNSADLNKTYRNQNKPTNVLSFPLELPEFVEEILIGDLAICAEIVDKEAVEQGKKSLHHWAHMTIHGTLHLMGYDHIIEEDANLMEALEIKLLHKLKIPNPYD